jgi:hypothetical protein
MVVRDRRPRHPLDRTGTCSSTTTSSRRPNAGQHGRRSFPTPELVCPAVAQVLAGVADYGYSPHIGAGTGLGALSVDDRRRHAGGVVPGRSEDRRAGAGQGATRLGLRAAGVEHPHDSAHPTRAWPGGTWNATPRPRGSRCCCCAPGRKDENCRFCQPCRRQAVDRVGQRTLNANPTWKNTAPAPQLRCARRLNGCSPWSP